MLNFRDWAKKEIGEEVPEQKIGDYIMKYGLPIVVCCTGCGSIMTLPAAWIDEEDQVYCTNCAGEE